MWFVFPQLRPRRLISRVGSAEEARVYLTHGDLVPRLECATRAVLSTTGISAHIIFGSPDDLKFRSSMTLFAFVSPASGKLFATRLSAGSADGWMMRQLALLEVSSRT